MTDYKEIDQEFDERYPYDTLVSAHQDWTYDDLKLFIHKKVKEAEERGYKRGYNDGDKSGRIHGQLIGFKEGERDIIKKITKWFNSTTDSRKLFEVLSDLSSSISKEKRV